MEHPPPRPASGHHPRLWSGPPGPVTWGQQRQPGAQTVGWRLRAYLGFELFQKTVWRSAAARLQQRPRRGAQRSSIARGRAGPGEDAGLLGGWAPAGFLPGAVGAALTDLAPEPRDSAFWAGAARPPAPPAPRPAPRCPAASRLGSWRKGVQGRGAAGRGAEPGAGRAPLPDRSAPRRVFAHCGSARGFVGLCVCVCGGVCVPGSFRVQGGR